VSLLIASPGAAQQPAAPRILYEASPRAVEYQIAMLSNAELVLVERKADPKFRPVYVALLTRKGLGREYFDEAIAALTKLDRASRTQVLLDALPKVAADDSETADKFLQVLFAQPADTLRKERALFAKAVADGSSPLLLRAGYGGMLLADGAPEKAWEQASKDDAHLVELLRSIPHLGTAPDLRAKLYDPVARVVTSSAAAPVRTAALAALGSTRADAAAFKLLAQEIINGTDADMRAAAVGSIQRVPREAWPAADVEPLARAIVAAVSKLPAARRTDPETGDALQLGDRLAEALPEASRRAVRRDLRALGVQIVRIQTVPEQMMFDLKWFVVEAGKLVQIVLFNPDAMSHNLLVVKPGSLKDVGIAATTMTMPTDPKAKPYVPDSPQVLQATRLLNWSETERLSFPAPKEPGEYPFVCTFPGHWVRMYGVMLVVDNLEAWEAKRTPPNDPMTGQPYPSQR
jgi:azurin